MQLESPLYDISPDGKELAFVADADPAVNVTNIDVYTVAIGGKDAVNRTPANAAADGIPLYSPDGRWLAFAQQRIKGFYGDLRRLMLLDRRSGAHARSGGRRLGPLGRRPGLGAGLEAPLRHDRRRAARCACTRFRSTASRASITGDETSASLAIATRAGALVGLRQTFLEPPTAGAHRPEVEAGDASSARSTTRCSPAPRSARYESVTYAGANGEPIQMWVNYPPGFDKSKKYPLFLLIHGGPHNAITNAMQFRWNAQVFGSWGYVTAWPNFHGSSGFGNAFTDSINPQQDDAALPGRDRGGRVVRGAAVDRRRPHGRRRRQLRRLPRPSIILGRPHPFKALVAHAAVYNWYTQVGADYAYEKPRFGGFWTPEQQAGVQDRLAALRRRQLQDARRWWSTASATCACR